MENIKDILKQEESKNLEFKEDLTSENKEKVLQTVIAFANLGGGSIIFGVNDQKNVTGIDNPFNLEEKITNMIYDIVTPTIRIDIRFATYENKTLLIIDIPKGATTPYYIKSKGIVDGTYIRVGSSTRLADRETIKALDLKKQNISFDSLPDYRFSKNDIDFYKVKKWFKEKREIEITEEHLFNLKILTKEGNSIYPTIAGILLFPVKEFPEYDYAKIKCALFKGTEPGIFIDKSEYRGSIISQIELTMKFIKKSIRLSATIGEIYRNEKYEYPLEAVREAIINAVVHRDYIRIGRDIRVGIYDNRIEIINPGELPATFSVNDIGKINFSELRNHTIGRVVSELGLIEQWGLGFTKIIKMCEQHEIERPEFREEAHNFKVTFYSKFNSTSLKCHQLSPNVTVIGDIGSKQFANVTKEERKKLIYQLISDEIRFSISDLERIFDKSSRTIKRDLATLKKEGKTKHIGSPANGFYKIIDK